MTDPERLLSRAKSGEESELEFQLLASLRDVAAPPGAKARAWDAIAGHVSVAAASVAVATAVESASQSVAPGPIGGPLPAVAPAPVVAPATPVATGLFHTLAGKIVAGVVLSGTVATVGGAWLVHRAPSAVVTKTVPAPPMATSWGAPSTANDVAGPTPTTSGGAPAPIPDAPPSPTENVVRTDAREPHETRRGSPDDRLDAESALLTEARARLHGGNAVGALGALRELDRRFPNGVLGQEREVLAIQALATLGDTAAARRRARAFVAAHPNSPHAALLSRLTVDP